MKEQTHNTIRKVQVFLAVSLLFVAVLFLFKDPGITGHFSADFRSQILDLEIGQSQKFLLSTNSEEPIYISSFRITGEVIGDGSVKVFIDNNAGQRILVYENIMKKEQGIPTITGMAIAGPDIAEAIEEKLILLRLLEEIEFVNTGLSLSADEEHLEGTFNNKCVDTCFIEMPLSTDSSYELIFNIQPGTKLKLTKITYTLKNDKI